jgi:hypothetical protein
VAKVSRPVLYGGILLLGVVAWFATAPDEPSSTGKKLSLNRGKSTTKGAAEEFTQEDLDASFPRLNEAARNAFNPLVARKESGSGGELAPNEIPASFTGGEAGWFYTGTTIVDDVPSALLENELTGQIEYLNVGDKVKRAVIAQIAPTYIVVTSPGGQDLRLNLLEDAPDEGVNVRDLGLTPVRPDVPGALRGPIRSGGFGTDANPDESEQS